MTGTSSLHFYSAHQGAVSLDNVKFGAKQLKAWAVTIGPDREGSYSGSMQATYSGTDIHSALLTHMGIQHIHPHGHTHIHLQ